MSTCRNCAAEIKPCNCGANFNRPHWIDGRSSRWCNKDRTHEPAAPTEGDQKP